MLFSGCSLSSNACYVGSVGATYGAIETLWYYLCRSAFNVLFMFFGLTASNVLFTFYGRTASNVLFTFYGLIIIIRSMLCFCAVSLSWNTQATVNGNADA